MGAGIAQVAAQAGHPVRLFDTREGAAPAALREAGGDARRPRRQGQARRRGGEGHRRADQRGGAARRRGRLRPGRRGDRRERSTPSARSSAISRPIVGDDGVLASNTSSISITALANGLKRPGRLVGMHFFNPVPLMKLVEVVSGLQTDAEVAAAIFDAEQALGQDAGPCALDAGLHRQPHRPPVLRRGALAPARAVRRAGDDRRLPARAPAFAWGRAS